MYTVNHDELRKVVNTHLGLKSGEASKASFDKAKTELAVMKTATSKAISLLTMEKYLEVVGKKAEAVTAAEQNAADLMDSYFIPLPSESINAAFARAKKELIAKLKKEVSQLKVFSFKDYGVKRRKKVTAKKVRATNFDNVRVEKKRMT